MAAERILVVAHNHPALHPGGTEIFAHDLFHAYKAAGSAAVFLGATNGLHRAEKPGTSFQAVGPAGDELLVWSGHFDRFNLSQIDLYGVVPDLEALLSDFRPDVVHIHHLLLIGAEFPALVRRVLPQARIVMTLHDYYPICAHDGLMMRTAGRWRPVRSSPPADPRRHSAPSEKRSARRRGRRRRGASSDSARAAGTGRARSPGSSGGRRRATRRSGRAGASGATCSAISAI